MGLRIKWVPFDRFGGNKSWSLGRDIGEFTVRRIIMNKALPMLGGKDVLVIDLSGHFLKIAHVKVSNIKREIINLVDHDIRGQSDGNISVMIEKYVKGQNLKNAGVYCPIPNRITMTKNIEVPSRDMREVSEIINLQAGRHTPFAREEIVADYLSLGVYKHTYTKILLIMVNRKVVTRQLDVLRGAGLKVEKMIFCPEAFAMAYPVILKVGLEEFPVILAQIDDDYTDFMVVIKNKILFVRSMPIGATHFLADKERSEEKFVEQIKLSMEAYQNEDIDSVPVKLYLMGATEGIKELEDKLNSSMHIPARIVPYFSHIPISDKAVGTLIEKARNISFLNVVATALSAEGLKVNLLPEEVKIRHKLEQKSKQLYKSGIYVLMLMVIACSFMISRIYFRSIYLKQLDNELKSISTDVNKVERAVTKVRVIKEYLTKQGHMLNVLAEIHDILPENTYFSDIKIEPNGQFSIKGFSDSMSSVFRFIGIMEESPYFEKVAAKYTSKRKEEDKDVAIFEIVGGVKGR